MELSPQKTREAKTLGCSVSEMVFADLVSLGYMKNDAYAIAFPESVGRNMQRQKQLRDELVSRTSIQNLIEERRKYNASRLEFSGNTSDIELIDTEMTAREILKIARQMPENSKERGEMFMKYADLTRKNDQKTEDITEAINFYFPVKCTQCPLLSSYNGWVRQQREKDAMFTPGELRPIEMEAVIRKAAAVIRKTEKAG